MTRREKATLVHLIAAAAAGLTAYVCYRWGLVGVGVSGSIVATYAAAWTLIWMQVTDNRVAEALAEIEMMRDRAIEAEAQVSVLAESLADCPHGLLDALQRAEETESAEAHDLADAVHRAFPSQEPDAG